ncbi:MAG: hypothetical protein ACE37N_10640 [Pseudohongiellaceae bacterium]
MAGATASNSALRTNQRDLATLIQMEVNDPRVGMVSVTGVEVSRDLAMPGSRDGDDHCWRRRTRQRRHGATNAQQIEEKLTALNEASGYLLTCWQSS